jgi:uncharacterized protein (TIGR02145 family)
MINNLKIGSTTGTTQLTPIDSNISQSWLLPQVGESADNYYDQALVNGPVPGSTDNINDSAFYGYLYNWCAATAGGAASGGANTCTASGIMPADAAGDICPANWRLPKGGLSDDVDNEFSQLNAKMAGYASNQVPDYIYNPWQGYDNFQNTGPFNGVESGNRNISDWHGQGDNGFFWSGTHDSSYAGTVYRLVFNSGNVNPGNTSDRSGSLAVRCLVR